MTTSDIKFTICIQLFDEFIKCTVCKLKKALINDRLRYVFQKHPEDLTSNYL